jgi:hypothetical protein
MKDGFKEISRLDTGVFVDPYSSQTLDVSQLYTGDNVLLVCDVAYEDNCYRSYYKSGNLEIVRDDSFDVISKTEKNITIRANKYLQAVELEGDYTFSDNYFTMLKGETKTVDFDKFSENAGDVTIKSYTLK